MDFGKFLWIVIFIPLISGLIHYRKLTISHRYLFFFIVVGVITELYTHISKLVTVVSNNMPAGHIYISVSFLFISLFYYSELKDYLNRKILLVIIILFEVFSVLNMVFFQSIYSYPSITGALSALVLVIFAIFLFSYILYKGEIKVLSDSSHIWINSAALLYYAGNFFYIILFNHLLDYSPEFLLSIVTSYRFLNFVFYLFIAVGFWKAARNPVSVKH